MKDSKQQVKKEKLEGEKVNPKSTVQVDPPSQIGEDLEPKVSVVSNTQSPLPVIEPSQPGKGQDAQVSQVEGTFMTPVLGKKRGRDEGSIATQEKKQNLIFRKCKMCTQIRSTLKLEIAECRKSNSLLREQIKSLKRDKIQGQASVSFLHNLYSDLDKKHKELEKMYTIALAKINNIKNLLK